MSTFNKKGSIMKNVEELRTSADIIDFIEAMEPFHDPKAIELASENDIRINLRAMNDLVYMTDEVYTHFMKKIIGTSTAEAKLENLLVAFKNVLEPEHFQKLLSSL